MNLNIDDPEAAEMVSTLAALTSETVEEAVITALRERLLRLNEDALESAATLEHVMEVVHHCAALPELDPRTAEEIIGYDENGLPS